MLKKTIVIMVILLFLISSLIPIVSSNKRNMNKTIYVDDDARPPYDGTIQHPYKTIQDGVNNSSDGDTVFVYNGTYHESRIDINITINLIGENREYTIIDTNQDIDGLYIRTNNVKISGFKIINSSRAGINLDSNTSDNVNISKNIFYNNAHGIHPYYNHKNLRISNNIFRNNTNGFTTVCCTNADIYQNIFIGNNWGMSIFQSSHCNIYYNHITTSNKFGIRLYGLSRNNNIHHNNFINNSMNACFFLLSLGNTWDSNYWNEPRSIPVPILGSLGLFFPPLINFDWNPSKEPNDIKIPEV
jgi:nitrous oxidase accessory protein NosD